MFYILGSYVLCFMILCFMLYVLLSHVSNVFLLVSLYQDPTDGEVAFSSPPQSFGSYRLIIFGV